MNSSYFLATSLVTLSFGLCLAQTSPTNAASPSSGTGIEGVVVMSPAGPGPTRQGVEDSKPVPNTKFMVMREGEEKPAASFSTSENGQFQVSLPPGRYHVVAEGGKRPIGSFGPFEVEVVAGKMTKVHWDCDSGLR